MNNIFGNHEKKKLNVASFEAKFAAGDNAAGKAIATLKSLAGDFEDSTAWLKKACEKDPTLCKKVELELDLIDEGQGDGQEVPDYTLEILGMDEPLTPTSKISVVGDMPYKLKTSRRGYTDDFQVITHFSQMDGDSITASMDPMFLPADTSLRINASKPFEVSSGDMSMRGEGDAFVFPDGTAVTGEIEIFFFAITARDLFSVNTGLLNLTAIGIDGSVAGSYMLSYGMPLIKAYKGDKELIIKKPLSGTMIMKDNNEVPYSFATTVPLNTWIDQEQAEKWEIPPFWNLDHNRGIWKPAKFRIINLNGTIEFTYQ
jgi:hypothetical protein